MLGTNPCTLFFSSQGLQELKTHQQGLDVYVMVFM